MGIMFCSAKNANNKMTPKHKIILKLARLESSYERAKSKGYGQDYLSIFFLNELSDLKRKLRKLE
jgi:hypothetical protein